MTTALLAEPPPTLFDGDDDGDAGMPLEAAGCRLAMGARPGAADDGVGMPLEAAGCRLAMGARLGAAGHPSLPGPTLDALITRLWERIADGTAPARCPVCADGPLRPELTPDGALAGATCGTCATVLS